MRKSAQPCPMPKKIKIMMRSLMKSLTKPAPRKPKPVTTVQGSPIERPPYCLPAKIRTRFRKYTKSHRKSSWRFTATVLSFLRRSICPIIASMARFHRPYHAKNKHIARKKLTQDEIRAEVLALQDMGHKRLAIETGEDPANCPIEYVLESIKTIYSVHHKNGDIRRVNVNIAATTVENYRKLKEAGIGTYILFQETYHKESYEALHPTGPKHNYAYHTEAMDRAMEGGIDDVGLGVLFGLERYKYEFAGLLMHAEHLEAVHGVGPHTISVPRLKRADDIDPDTFDNGIDDDTFAKIVACIRLAVPYTGMIVSTRESEAVRTRLLNLGISQASGASRTSVGGYTEEERPHDSEQFDVSDQRTLDEVVRWLMENNHIPSFCTACYRMGRTGDRFMSLCKSGQILNCCHPNALMTLSEYLEDYASPETKQLGYEVIERELQKIPHEKVHDIAAQNIADIRSSNRRDFNF